MKKRERGGRRAMKQNLFWAFGYNVIGIGLALYGLLTPIYAAFAMVLSSLFVTLNASRIGRGAKRPAHRLNGNSPKAQNI